MVYLRYFFIVLALTSPSIAVKVNVQGSLTFGKEVMDTVKYLLRRNQMSGRRSMSHHKGSSTDTISLLVNSAFLCKELELCKGSTRTFLNEYIIAMTKAMENIFKELVNGNGDETNDEDSPKKIIFENKLENILRDTKKILDNANKKITEEKEAMVWTDIIKKISAMFQERAILFSSDRLEGDPKDVDEVKKKLTHTFVFTTIQVESAYQSKLCSDHNICIKYYGCTKTLNTILSQFKTMPEEKVKRFVRHVHEALPDTTFYYHLSEVTAKEFEDILDDMSNSQHVAAKDVLSSIQQAVEARINSLNTKTHSTYSHDVDLVHIILSDMDNFYSRHKVDPFQSFLDKFFVWSDGTGKLGSHVRQIVKDICNKMSFESGELVVKLINEVRVFLEITVDPEG